MTGTTRTIQQPASTGSILAALGMAAVILAAAVGFAWGAANLGKANQAPAAAPAALYAPAVRDLGIRDQGSSALLGLAPGPVVDHGSSEGFGATGATGYHGFGNQADRPNSTSGSNGDAPAGRNLALRAQ